MRQLLSDLRTGVPLHEGLKDWWNRESRGIVLGVAIVLLGWVGYQQVQLSHVNQHQCQDISVVANISSDTVATELRNSRALLPKISLPGLTHQELLTLVAQSEAREHRHQHELERVAQESCGR